MNPENRRLIQSHLLDWFDTHQRILPWRENRSLYGTWISEIMLQQTTVGVVVPYWEKFMRLFPNVHTLASADEATVLALWSGLGYYRRARNLHKAACHIVETMDGKLPSSRHQWRELPGIGPYASGAIASIGLGEVVPAVDANARRVLSRWFFDSPVDAGILQPAALEEMGAEMVSCDRPGDWNEAVMELGATLCRSSVAHCDGCPVLDQCQAGLAGVALDIPPVKKKTPAVAIAMATVIVRRGAEILLLPPGEPELVPLDGHWEVGRKNTSGLHQGLWSLPVTPWYSGTEAAFKALETPEFIKQWIEEHFPLSVLKGNIKELAMASFGHSITRYRLGIRTWLVQIPDDWQFQDSEGGSQGTFIAPPFDQPVSKLVSKSMKMFELGNV